LTDGIISIVHGGILMSDCQNIETETGNFFYSLVKFIQKQI